MVECGAILNEFAGIMDLVGKHRTRVITTKKTGNLPCAMNKNIHSAPMSPEVQELFSSDIRGQCFPRFGVKSALLISNWHSFTFEAEISTGPCILKITRWSDRLKLAIGPEDDFIGTPKIQVRVPRVIIAVNFNKVPLKRPRLTLKYLRERDNHRCAYSGRVLAPYESSMEHVVPKSKGGATRWENVVLADKRINSIRGNLTLEEADLKLNRT
jgi:5-methylcytosine-specific restriction endonuclease McrA